MNQILKMCFKNTLLIDLSASIGSEANLQRVIDKLFSRYLITRAVYDDITTTPSYSAYDKGSKAVRELHRQIQNSREPKQTLLKICDELLSTNDHGLKDIATDIKYGMEQLFIKEILIYY